MFIVTVKSIDADSFALPTLYGKTTSQNYNFSTNPQGHKGKFFLLQKASESMAFKASMYEGWYPCFAALSD